MTCPQLSGQWLGAEDYQKHVLLPKVKKVLEAIQEEYKAQLKDIKHNFVLVHPTPHTLVLRHVSETEPQFKRLVSALASGIDVKSMYAAGLFKAMQMQEVFDDRDCTKAFSHMCTSFNGSETLGELQRFARDAVICSETFGWFAIGERDESRVPYVDLDAIIVHVSPLNEWVARSLENKPLKLHFMLPLGPTFKPLSTVSFMLPRYQSMQVVREYHMRSLHYSSRPNFLTSVQMQPSGSKGSEVLNETLVNQATMNDHLEGLIRENLQTCTSTQKSVQMQGKLHEYVSQMGNEHISRVRAQEHLQRKVEVLEMQLKELKGEVDNFKPYQYNLPEGQKIDGAHLSVSPFDIVGLEEAYQREWYRVCTGVDSLTRRDHVDEHRRDASEGKSLLVPQQRYQEIIVNELLADWARRNHIPLEVTSVKHRVLDLADLMSMREILHPSRLAFLLSQVLDLPMEQIVVEDRVQPTDSQSQSKHVPINPKRV